MCILAVSLAHRRLTGSLHTKAEKGPASGREREARDKSVSLVSIQVTVVLRDRVSGMICAWAKLSLGTTPRSPSASPDRAGSAPHGWHFGESASRGKRETKRRDEKQERKHKIRSSIRVCRSGRDVEAN